MGLLECAVVVYLRELSFPNGFDFPLKPIGHNLAAVELWREVATIFMLVAVGWMAGHNKKHPICMVHLRLCHLGHIFITSSLKFFWTGRPPSLLGMCSFSYQSCGLGPVWAPVLLSLMMIAFAVIINQINAHTNRPIGRMNWALLISGSAVCIVSFCVDFVRFSINKVPNFTWTDLLSVEKSFSHVYVPEYFPIAIFGFGIALIVFRNTQVLWDTPNHVKTNPTFSTVLR